MEPSSIIHLIFLVPLSLLFIFVLSKYTIKDILLSIGAVMFCLIATFVISNYLGQDWYSVLKLREPSKASGAMTLIYAFSIAIAIRVVILILHSVIKGIKRVI